MFRAVFFDFNGVVVDDEPVHFELFQKVLADIGVKLDREHYYRDYLGMDDHDCLLTAARDAGRELSEFEIGQLTEQKAKAYEARMQQAPPFVKGVKEFIQSLAKEHYLAVVSGALRPEIEMLLRRAEILDLFSVIVAAGEISHGKPSPEGYQKAFDLLNRDFIPTHQMLLPAECLVFEDSIWGIQAAAAADMSVVGVTSSYSAAELPGAIEYIQDFHELSADFLQALAEK